MSLIALLALGDESLCHGTSFQIDVPDTALYSAQEIQVQIKWLCRERKKEKLSISPVHIEYLHFPSL